MAQCVAPGQDEIIRNLKEQIKTLQDENSTLRKKIEDDKKYLIIELKERLTRERIKKQLEVLKEENIKIHARLKNMEKSVGALLYSPFSG